MGFRDHAGRSNLRVAPGSRLSLADARSSGTRDLVSRASVASALARAERDPGPRGHTKTGRIATMAWMRWTDRHASRRRGIAASAGLAVLAWVSGPAEVQTYGLATMQPGTLAHATGSAIAKVLKEKGGLNTLVQSTAGESVLIPMVARGEIDLGIANLAEVQAQVEGSGPNRQADLRLIGVLHPLWASFFVRKDTTMKANADMKGKRIALGYSAMRTVDML